MEDLKKKNITIDAMEDFDNNNAKPVVKNTTFDAKNYLNVRLDTKKGELEKEMKIRLLPILDGGKYVPFKVIKMHSIKVPEEISESGFKSYVCLEKVDDIDHEKYGNKCPFCEMNREAYKKFTEADNNVERELYKKISLANKAIDVGIIRCIERGHEEDGPKFWKFNIRQDEKDPMHQINNIYKTRMRESIEEGDGEFNVLDLYEGKDLKVTITAVLDKNTNKPTNKTSVSIVDYGKIKPISEDDELIEKWVDDPKVWSDVFVPKTYDYLSILNEGGIPWFDRNANKWVPKSLVDEEAQKQKEETKVKADEMDKKIEEAKKSVTSVDVENNEEELPF